MTLFSKDLLRDWIEAGEWGPLPWPDQPFVERWLREQGYSPVNGSIGMVATVDVAPAAPDQEPER